MDQTYLAGILRDDFETQGDVLSVRDAVIGVYIVWIEHCRILYDTP